MSSDPISVTKASRCVGQIGRADGNPGKTYHTSSYQTRPTDLQETASNVSHRYVKNSLSKVCRNMLIENNNDKNPTLANCGG